MKHSVALSAIGMLAGEELDNSLTLINDKLNSPCRITYDDTTDLISISSAEVQKQISDGADGVQSDYKEQFAPSDTNFLQTASGTLNIQTGAITGGLNVVPTLPTMVLNDWIALFFYLTSDNKLKAVFSTKNAVKASIVPPTFPSDLHVKLGHLFLKAQASGSTWAVINFDHPLSTDMLQYKTSSLSAPGQSILEVENEGSSLDIAVTKFNFKGAGVVAEELVNHEITVTIPGEVGGDRSYYTELLNETNEDGGPLSMRDFFDSTINGTTLTNMELINNALALNVGQNSGSYVIQQEVGNSLTRAEAKAIITLDSMAPKSISGTTTITMTFYNDVASLVPVGKNIICFKKKVQIQTDHIHLFDSNNELVKFSIASSSYASGTGLTTITFSNSDSYDVAFGYSSEADLRSYVRITPFDHKYEASLTATPSYTELDVTGMQGVDRIGLTKINYLKEIVDATITGTIDKWDGVMSENGQYGLVRILENITSSGELHFFYSSDFGSTWTKSSTVKATNQVVGNETDGNYVKHSSTQLGVANNGKVFAVNAYYSGSRMQAHGLYGDLTVTGELSPTPTVGLGDGILYDNSSYHGYGQIGYDRDDMSFVSVLIKASHLYGWCENFTAGGSVYQNKSDNLVAAVFQYDMSHVVQVTGTGASHKTYVTWRDSSARVYAQYLNQGVNAFVNVFTGLGGNGYFINGSIVDAKVAGDTYVCWSYNSSSGAHLTYANLASLPYAYNANQHTISGLPQDLYNGWATSTQQSLIKHINQRLIIDPSDDNHVFAYCDLQQPNGYRDSVLFEIPDVTDIDRISIDGTSDVSFMDDAARDELAQTFTPAANTTLQCTSARFYKVGAPNGAITCEIQNTTGGLPNGSVVATASNTIDTNKLHTNTSGEEVYFEFNNVSLVASTQYAMVIKTDLSTDASNYLIMKANYSNPYAGGTRCNRTSSGTWSSSAAHDMAISINNYWITKMGDANNVDGVWNQESCMSLIGSKIQCLTRKVPYNIAANLVYMGHPYKRDITISATSAKSAISSVTCAAYEEASSDFDKNLVFSVALGSDDCKDRNLITGLYSYAVGSDQGAGVGDKSIGLEALSAAPPTLTVDPVFEAGVCGLYSSNYTSYAINKVYHQMEKDFVMEVEMNNTAATSDNILSTYYVPAPGSEWGWQLGFNSSSYLQFFWINASGVVKQVVASDKVEPTAYHKVKVKKVGTTVSLWRAENSANNYTVFTEVASYSTQDTYAGYRYNTTYSYLIIGAGDTGASAGIQLGAYFSGKIGYVKIAFGANSFVYDGFKSRPPIVSIQSISDMLLGKKMNGVYSGFSPYNEAGLSKDGRPFVDSYDHLVTASKSQLTAGKFMNFKLTQNRGSAKVKTAYKTIDIKMSK